MSADVTKAQRIIRTPSDFGQAVVHLGNMQHPFTMWTQPGEPKEDRTSAQNKTVHMWFGEIAKALCELPAEVKAECNLTYGVPILRRDNDEWARAFSYIFDSLNRPTKLKAMRVLDVPVTRNMNTAQLSEYMEQMQKDYREQGVNLTDPEAMKYGNSQ